MANTMEFLENLKQKFSDAWLRLCVRLDETVRSEGPPILYALAVVTALTSAYAANQYGAFQGLVSLLTGVGAGALANRLTGKLDEKQATAGLSELLAKIEGADALADARAVLAELQNTPDLKAAADVLLEQTDALGLAEAAFAQEHAGENERQWFAETLQQALQQVGSRLQTCPERIAHVQTGDESQVAIGDKAKAMKDSIDLQGAKVKAKRDVHFHIGIQQPTTQQLPASSNKQQAASIQQPATSSETHYLQNLHTTCNLLPLSALAGDRDRHTAARMTLSDVYIELNTTDRVDKQGKVVQLEAREPSSDNETRPLTILEAAARNEALVILGDPGSGKSSFVNHLLACHATKLLDDKVDLPKAWTHGALMPVRILLRELAITLQKENAAALLKESAEKCQQQLCQMVLRHIDAQQEIAAADTSRTSPDSAKAGGFAEGLHNAIAEKGALIVFDGLDEVPDGLRSLVRYAVETFCAYTRGNRFFVTCRILSYGGDTQLQHFPTATLAPFTQKQVDRFIERWYLALALVETWPENRRKDKTADLQKAVRTLPQTLVQNPMLLTTMANVHARNVKLPRQRVRLYKEASKVLLWRWQEEKEQSLFEEIGLEDDSKIFPALWEMGYMAQKSGARQETTDISEGHAYEILKRHFAGLAKPGEAADKFLGFVDRTAGLLIGRGGSQGTVIAFPHRTFQEYFAGCWLAKGGGDLSGEALNHLPQGDDWRLAAQLGVEEMLYNDSNLRPVLSLVYDLCMEKAPKAGDTAAWRGIYWAALFVLEIGKERILQDEKRRGGQPFLDRLQARLIAILENGLLPARERAEAGFALGKLGDERPGVCTLPPTWIDLPREIKEYKSDKAIASSISRGEPGGRFTMGEGKDAHQVELSPFKISKYPVTNAQFRAFYDAGGYNERKWWSDDGWKYRQERNWQEPRWWEDERFNLPNQPVVGVSWFEAGAFCRWLTAEIGSRGERERGVVRLPTEAEWEFAARGAEGRRFPWGKDEPREIVGASSHGIISRGEPTPEHANYWESKIGRPTAVGCYPQGATPETGIFDLAGNVWEWCQDRWHDSYKDAPADGSAWETGESSIRVVRGGSWDSVAQNCRSAARIIVNPDFRDRNIGFRLVLAVSLP